MNQVPVIVCNPAYVADVELDEVEVDPADLTPLVSKNAPIVTVPASEDEDVAEDVVEDRNDEEEMEDVPQMFRDVISSLGELNTEFRSILSPAPGDTCSHQPPVVPHIDVWDTGRAWEREYKLYPDPSRKEISDTLFNQVVDLRRIMHKRISQQTWNERDKELIDGLNNITVMHVRLSRLTEKMLKNQAKRPTM